MAERSKKNKLNLGVGLLLLSFFLHSIKLWQKEITLIEKKLKNPKRKVLNLPEKVQTKRKNKNLCQLQQTTKIVIIQAQKFKETLSFKVM